MRKGEEATTALLGQGRKDKTQQGEGKKMIILYDEVNEREREKKE